MDWIILSKLVMREIIGKKVEIENKKNYQILKKLKMRENDFFLREIQKWEKMIKFWEIFFLKWELSSFFQRKLPLNEVIKFPFLF